MGITGTIGDSEKLDNRTDAMPSGSDAAGIDRLPATLPEFTRYSWVSDLARRKWEPEIQRISRAWSELEWRSVAEQVRACALQSVSPERLPDYSAQLASFGLSVLPLAKGAATDLPYSSVLEPPEPGKPFTFRVVAGKIDALAKFQEFWTKNDQSALGELLGYPRCCRRFFERVWIRERWLDTTWSMAANTPDAEFSDQAVQLSGPPEANILLRWLGVRAVFHLPCSFRCPSTVEVAQRLREVGNELGYEAEMDRLLEMLSWPVEWSALHGIAEIKTPVVKVTVRTDATPTKLVVRRRGEGYPEEGADGIRFPYQAPRKRPLTVSPSFQKGLSHQSPNEKPPSWYFEDNGFPSLQAMKTAHHPIVQAICRSVEQQQEGAVLDLGCGNGALLASVRRLNPRIQPFGVDRNPKAVAHAGRLLPDDADRFFCGDLFKLAKSWSGKRYSIILLTPGRLLEVEDREGAKLRSWLQSSSAKLLLYAYGDWLQREGGLASLARKAGFLPLEATAPSVLWARVHQGG